MILLQLCATDGVDDRCEVGGNSSVLGWMLNSWFFLLTMFWYGTLGDKVAMRIEFHPSELSE